MMTLYQFSTSPFCEKVRRALAYKGLEYQIHEVPRFKVSEYLAVSPGGKFPAIEHDGHAVCDSTDIIEYLDQAFPQRPLIPSDPAQAALAHVIEDWADESLYFYEMTMRIAWEHNCRNKVIHEFVATMPGVTVEQALPMVVSSVETLVKQQGLGRKPRAAIVKDAERHIQALDGLLTHSDWLAGPALTVADLAVAVQLRALLYAEEVVPMVAARPRVQAWISRVDRLAPGMQNQANRDE